MNQKIMTTVLIVVVVVAAVVVGVTVMTRGKLGESQGRSAKSKGPLNASIKVVEYIDFQCPMCAKGAMKLKEYMKDYPDKIHLEMRYFPLDMHRHAFIASQYAECAAQQNKFWEFHDLILEHQKDWAELVNAAAVFDIYAKEAGLDADQLKACLPSKTVDDLIEKYKKEGKDLGIRSTPTYFINGEMVVGIKVLEEKIDALLGVSAAQINEPK